MRLPILAGIVALSSLTSSAQLRARDYNVHDFYAVHLTPSASPEEVASYFGLELEGQLGALEDHYLFRKGRHNHNLIEDAMREHKRRVERKHASYRNDILDSILLHQKQKLKPPMEKRGPLYPHLNPRQDDGGGEEEAAEEDPAAAYYDQIVERLGITDPIFNEQWHLYNPKQLGHDLNVSGVWLQGITGKNSSVCIVDDGLDMDSEDLKDNYYPEGSWDFNDKGPDPRPRLSDDRHGTRCAGEVSAVKNDVCGVGVAWDSKIAGIRILSRPITDADEAIALNYNFENTQIYSCSWGPPDDGQQMGEPGILIKRAMVNAVQNGRGGLGNIYVFAAGNGAAADDNCNFDGYTNSIYSITVGAIDRKGEHPYYSEKCSAQLVVTYSSGSGDAIHTTDVGVHNCYAGHGGTSAAGPLAAGVYALVLELRPDLTWRDVQWLTVQTAVTLDQESDWQITAVGKNYSHQYGFGKIDAWALIEAAKDFVSVKPQAWYFSPWQHVRHAIPEGETGLASHFTVTEEMMQGANIERLEHVAVTMNVQHSRRGDVSVDLYSPSGIVSHLSTARQKDVAKEGYQDWTFMSVAHWGESGLGDWTIIVKDTVENEHNGTFVDYKLRLFGEARDASIQGLLPLPNESDDDDHDREDANVSSIPVAMPATTQPPVENPTDHIHRPVNDKVTTTDAPEATATAEPVLPGDEHEDENYNEDDSNEDSGYNEDDPVDDRPFNDPIPTTSPDLDDDYDDNYSDEEMSTPTTHPLLPTFLPTFGVSHSTQLWIYASTTLILLFCLGITIYLLSARRRRVRTLQRENYEFEVLENEDDAFADPLDGKNVHGRSGGKKGKRRAGELYDAFAPGGSDGEEEDEGVFSEEEKEKEDEGSVGRGGQGYRDVVEKKV